MGQPLLLPCAQAGRSTPAFLPLQRQELHHDLHLNLPTKPDSHAKGHRAMCLGQNLGTSSPSPNPALAPGMLVDGALELVRHALAVILGQAVHDATLHAAAVSKTLCNETAHLLHALCQLALLLAHLIPAHTNNTAVFLTAGFCGASGTPEDLLPWCWQAPGGACGPLLSM